MVAPCNPVLNQGPLTHQAELKINIVLFGHYNVEVKERGSEREEEWKKERGADSQDFVRIPAVRVYSIHDFLFFIF